MENSIQELSEKEYPINENLMGIQEQVWVFKKREGFIKGYETALDEKDKLTNSLLTYSENQRKIIVLLLDAIETVRGHLPFSTDLKLTEIINSSQKFTRPLPPPPIQKPSK